MYELDAAGICECSTPYGIRGLAPDYSHRPRAVLVVLNALRHQRFGTADSSSASRTTLVLNALRHQRFGTRRQGLNHRQGLNVLNALRHQRFGTLLQPGVQHGVKVCSTPYGIRGLAPPLLGSSEG